jgi:hypothetical protein
MHPDGQVAIMDRSKDIIISGGEVRDMMYHFLSCSRLIASESCRLNFPLYVFHGTGCFPIRMRPAWRLNWVSDRSDLNGVNNRSIPRLRLGFAELSSHPHVLEVSVVARPHPKWGERPMAFVILREQHKDEWHGRHDAFANDLKQHARKRLPGFACPEWVQVVDQLPVRLLCLPFTVIETIELMMIVNR